MPLVDYLPETMAKPLPIKYGEQFYQLPNLNSLTWSELYRMHQNMVSGSLDWLSADWLREGYGVPYEIIAAMSIGVFDTIINKWYKMAGVNPTRIGQIIWVLDNYDREFSYDLRRLTHIDGIQGFLQLKLIDAVDVFAMFISEETASWTWVRIQGFKFPLTYDTLVGADVYHALRGLSTAFGGKLDQQHTRFVETSDINDVINVIDRAVLQAEEEPENAS